MFVTTIDGRFALGLLVRAARWLARWRRWGVEQALQLNTEIMMDID